MIILTPSMVIQKVTGIDFDTLGNIITLVMEKNFNRTFYYRVNIHKSRDVEVSSVILNINQHYQRDFKMLLSPYDHLKYNENLKYNIGTILHEIRHIIQHTLFRYKVTGTFKTTAEYMNSTEEIDARNFEKLTTVITNSYKLLAENARQVFEKNNLGTLVQL